MNKGIRKKIIKWNNTFPLDSWFRKKYNIPFNSPQHRATCQIDIYFEWLESKVFDELYDRGPDILKKEERSKLIPEGKFLVPQQTEKELSISDLDLFDKIDIEKSL